MQVLEYIREQVQEDNYEFSLHAEHEREDEHNPRHGRVRVITVYIPLPPKWIDPRTRRRRENDAV